MPSSQYAQFVRVCQLTEMVSTSAAWIICRRIGVQSGVYQRRTTRGERNNHKMPLKDHETMFYAASVMNRFKLLETSEKSSDTRSVYKK